MAQPLQQILGKHIKQLSELHTNIGTVCSRLGISIDQSQSKNSSGCPSPWHESFSPREVINSVQQVFANPPDINLAAQDLWDQFSKTAPRKGSDAFMAALAEFQGGPMMSALIVASWPNYPNPGKVAVLLESLVRLQEAESAMPKESVVAHYLSWLVNDILTFSILKNGEGPVSFAKGSEMVLRYQVDMFRRLSDLALTDRTSTTGETSNSGIMDRLEQVLIALARQYPDSRPIVSMLLKYGARERCDDELLGLGLDIERVTAIYPDPLSEAGLGSAVLPATPSPEEIEQALLQLVDSLLPPIFNHDAWADPVGAAVQQLAAHNRISFASNYGTILPGSPTLDFLLEIVEKQPMSQVVFDVGHFFTRTNENDSSFKDLAMDLNRFVKTELLSTICATTSQPDFESRKRAAADVLSEVKRKVGRQHLIVTASPRSYQSEDGIEQATALLVTNQNYAVWPSIHVHEHRKEMDLGHLVQVLTGEGARENLSHVPSILSHCVIPTLLSLLENKGTVGWCPGELVALIKGKDLPGVGHFPDGDWMPPCPLLEVSVG